MTPVTWGHRLYCALVSWLTSLIHLALFSPANPASWLRFTVFAGATLALAVLCARAWLGLPGRGRLGQARI